MTATDTGLAGVAELTQALAGAAGTPGVLVIVDGDLGEGACIYGDPCSGVRTIALGAGLLADPGRTRLAGALAHEIAHRALGHLTGRRPWWYVTRVMAAAAVGAAIAGYPTPAVIAAGVMLLAHLLDGRECRGEELAADAYSITLLEAAGLPGRKVVAETLAQIPADGPWYRTVGWVAGSHPTVVQRRRAALGDG